LYSVEFGRQGSSGSLGDPGRDFSGFRWFRRLEGRKRGPGSDFPARLWPGAVIFLKSGSRIVIVNLRI
jgi:hypothetical protein